MSQAAISVVSRLGELVGSRRVITDAASLEAYEVDGHRPSAALQPSSVADIAETLRFASAERLAVIPIGGRTHLHIGMPPHPYELALDVSQMNRVLAFEPHDLTLGVEPGITHAELDRTLREKGQFLPLAPPLAERATIGGIVAAAADTPFRYAHGTTRDFLLGIEFVTGEGIVSKSGGRVVKNVTGYDLHKLFIGSLGTLGVMTRLNFRTFPLPPDQKMFVAAFREAAGALALCRAITKSPLQPRILDVLDPGAAHLFATRDAGFWAGDSWLVVIEAAGQEAVLERYARDLAAISKEAQASEFVALDKSQRDQIFACLCEFGPLAFGTTSSAMIFRVASLASTMPALLEGMRKLADARGFKYAILIRALGVVYFAFLPPAGPNVFPELLSCSREMMDLCVTCGAAPMIERCPLEIKKTLDMWPPARAEHEIAERLKHVFDPNSILSPRRFRGGI
jgi:glycolate oxidase FAD binding subunit